ncbi:MAG: adenylosuccinate synthase [Nitrospinae bacterium RIFCSPLOWO2_12_FULL_45_22]|nr:MAG: adenylosuccinate synthase [Nitrospinae bacterium RIFCSPLOWO2_12_FULL_45_22]
MSVQVVVGAQWGDEGKGKIVDVLSEKADVIARYQGGPNAGHTVVLEQDKFVLHLIPSGILRPAKVCIVGHGVVVDPEALLEEIAALENKNIKVKGNLFASKKAHLIMPYHKIIDQRSEQLRGNQMIGTTGRGIGPAYTDKVARLGIRLADLLDSNLFKEKLLVNLQEKNFLLKNFYGLPDLSFDTVYAQYMSYGERLKDYITDTDALMKEALGQGRSILIEGAQGTMLDVDHGTYPFVTSSSSSVGGVCTGLGIAPSRIDEVIGVAKAYTTRVGSGPFPTELTNDSGQKLRDRGNEYGATTGRPRRCGWFDAVVVRHAVWVNGIKKLAITKLDVLDQFDKIFICTGYRYKGEMFRDMPCETEVLEKLTPVYKELEGWRQNTAGLTSYEHLPLKAKNYLKRLSDEVEANISLISTGPQRTQTIFLKNDGIC